MNVIKYLSPLLCCYSQYIIVNKRKLYSLLTFICFAFLTSNSYALGLSTFRIYLDNNKRDYDFIVFNRDAYQQDCKIFLRHYSMDENGVKTLEPDSVIPEHSAKGLIKFSPRSFTLDPGNSQSIRFQLRRKSKQEAREYRSYLSLDCGMSAAALKAIDKNAITLKPKLRHNLPIIVRTGEVNVKVKFKDISINNNSILSAVLTKNGERSVYGDIELVDTRNNEVVASKSQVGIHLESENVTFSLSTHKINPKYLKLRFSEDKSLGGDQFIEKNIL